MTGRKRPPLRHAGKSKEQLIEELSLLEESLDALPDAVAAFDADDRLVFFNAAYHDLYETVSPKWKPGITYSEMAQILLTTMSPEDAKGREDDWIAERLVRHRHLDAPQDRVYKSGQIIRISQHPTASDGSIDIRTDVTELRQSQSDEKRLQVQLEALMVAMPMPMFFKAPDGRFLGCNQAFERFLGKTSEEIVGARISNLFDSDMAVNHEQVDADLFISGGSNVSESFARAGNGSIRNVIFYKSIIGGKDEPQTMAGVMIDITELRSFERALQQSEARWSTLFQLSPNPMILTGWGGGQIREVNDAWCATWGFERGHVVGKKTRDIAIWQTYSDRVPFDEELGRRGLVDGFEAAFQTRDGLPRIARIDARKVVLDGVEQLLSVVADITDRKLAESALAESEQQFRNLIEGSGQAVTIFVKNKVVFANEMAVKIFGFDSFDDFMAADPSKVVVSPEDRERIRGYREMRKNGQSPPSIYEFQAMRGDGGSVWLENRVTDIIWRGEAANLFFTVDITERKSTVTAIERFVGALEFLPQGIALWDAKQKLIYNNEQYRKILGLAGKYLIPGADLTEIHQAMAEVGLIDDSVGRVDDWVADRMRELEQPNSDRRFRRNGRWFQRTSRLLPDGSLIIQTDDIDDMMTAEEKLRQSQKMEAVGQLTGGIAHDFNNLLAVMLGHLELAADGLPAGSDISTMLDKAIAAGNRGAELVHRLLAFSANQALSPEIVNINQRLDATVDMLHRVFDETIDIQINRSAEPWFCKVDPGQMETALLNLAINARDAMPTGGSLTIDVGRTHFAHGNGLLAAGHYLTLTVSDTGAGMPENVLSRVFEPFYTTKEQGKGTGLGLSMVYGFVKQSAGEITIDSTLGVGTSVKIHLPLCDPPDSADTSAIEVQTNETANETILLVEDDADLLEMASQLLQSLGYAVHEASDGLAACEFLETGARVDLLLTDVVLPKGLNGLDVAARAKKHCPGIKVLFMSGYNEHPMLKYGDASQPITLINKPFRKIHLANEVRLALGHGN